MVYNSAFKIEMINKIKSVCHSLNPFYCPIQLTECFNCFLSAKLNYFYQLSKPVLQILCMEMKTDFSAFFFKEGSKNSHNMSVF